MTLLACCWPILAWPQASTARQTVAFNDGWYFHLGPLPEQELPERMGPDWQPVRLPHTWNHQDVLADGRRGYYRGEAWYQKHFLLMPDRGKRYFLRFGAANQRATVYLNGEVLGTHLGGYTAFQFDLTPYLRTDGQQRLAVLVDNAHDEEIPPLSADFTFFGGIYRDVDLISTGKAHFSMSDHGGSGLYWATPKLDSNRADLFITAKLRSTFPTAQPAELSLRAIGQDGRVLFERKQALMLPERDSSLTLRIDSLEGFKLWSTGQPFCYRLEGSLSVDGQPMDHVAQPLGFRWFHFDPARGFFLNGQPLKLMGANRHQDRVPYGPALSSDMHRYDMQWLKGMGGNFLRTAHYPQDRSVLEAADQLGLCVWEEIPIVNEISLRPAFDANSMQMLREMIQQHRNHPSIIIWGYMNEIYWAHRFKAIEELPARNAWTVRLAKRLEEEARKLDPDRFTAMALHNYPAYSETGLDTIPQIVGWNLYHGWYYGDYADFGAYMDEQHRLHPERVHILSEFGAGGDPRIYTDSVAAFDFSNEGQLNFMAAFWQQIKARDYLAGAAVWNLADFSSERRVDANSHINNKGLLTTGRVPKDAYYLSQAACSSADVAVLGHVQQPNFTYVAKHEADSLAQITIRAFSNLPKLHLIVNGTQPIEAQTEGYTAEWPLSLPAGTHVFSLAEGQASENRAIDVRIVPFRPGPLNEELRVNLGAAYHVFDSRTQQTWVPEKPYEAGSWGYIGGQQLYISNKIGTKEDIRTVVDEDPVLQTMRSGIESFRADVEDGYYEISLWLVDHVPHFRRFADVDTATVFRPDERIFSIKANGQLVQEDLDLGGQLGLNTPLEIRWRQQVENGQGLKLDFISMKGRPVASAIAIRRFF